MIIITQTLVLDKRHNLTAIWWLWNVKMTDDLILERRVILVVKSILQSEVVAWYEKTSISPRRGRKLYLSTAAFQRLFCTFV